MTIKWRANRADVDPSLAAWVEAALGPLPDLYLVTDGYRSAAEQNAAYAKGRDATGRIVNAALIVTNAKGGQSAHNQRPSMGIDFAPVINGQLYYEPNAETATPRTPVWANAVRSIRLNPQLKTGADIVLANGSRDYGHVEIRNWKTYVAPQPATPAEATGTPGVAGGGGVIPASSGQPGGGSPPLSASTSAWFELDAGWAIGAAAFFGLGILLWRARRA